MGKKLDLRGKKFGRLVVVERSHQDNHNKYHWRCNCDCGKETLVVTGQLINGRTKSCGCLHKEVVSKTFTTHGLSKIPEFDVWAALIQRCTNKNNKKYSDYGGRGITVCDRWINSFEAFYHDMGPRPSPDLSIDRMDNDRGYYPENCKWATDKEQAMNKRVRKSSVSGVNGVVWSERDKLWYSYITVNKKYTYLGCSKNIEEAIETRRNAEEKYWNKKPS